MTIYLLDDSLSIDIFFEDRDCDFEDCICVTINESCAEDEKLFKADETNIYITPIEARRLAQALLAACEASNEPNNGG